MDNEELCQRLRVSRLQLKQWWKITRVGEVRPRPHTHHNSYIPQTLSVIIITSPRPFDVAQLNTGYKIFDVLYGVKPPGNIRQRELGHDIDANIALQI